jgi:hypothetical protein
MQTPTQSLRKIQTDKMHKQGRCQKMFIETAMIVETFYSYSEQLK